jgi:hypothetical protein
MCLILYQHVNVAKDIKKTNQVFYPSGKTQQFLYHNILLVIVLVDIYPDGYVVGLSKSLYNKYKKYYNKIK